jgi:hypothetical protein
MEKNGCGSLYMYDVHARVTHRQHSQAQPTLSVQRLSTHNLGQVRNGSLELPPKRGWPGAPWTSTGPV